MLVAAAYGFWLAALGKGKCARSVFVQEVQGCTEGSLAMNG
jgi:hypothetical protein